MREYQCACVVFVFARGGGGSYDGAMRVNVYKNIGRGARNCSRPTFRQVDCGRHAYAMLFYHAKKPVRYVSDWCVALECLERSTEVERLLSTNIKCAARLRRWTAQLPRKQRGAVGA